MRKRSLLPLSSPRLQALSLAALFVVGGGTLADAAPTEPAGAPLSLRGVWQLCPAAEGAPKVDGNGQLFATILLPSSQSSWAGASLQLKYPLSEEHSGLPAAFQALRETEPRPIPLLSFPPSGEVEVGRFQELKSSAGRHWVILFGEGLSANSALSQLAREALETISLLAEPKDLISIIAPGERKSTRLPFQNARDLDDATIKRAIGSSRARTARRRRGRRRRRPPADQVVSFKWRSLDSQIGRLRAQFSRAPRLRLPPPQLICPPATREVERALSFSDLQVTMLIVSDRILLPGAGEKLTLFPNAEGERPVDLQLLLLSSSTPAAAQQDKVLSRLSTVSGSGERVPRWISGGDPGALRAALRATQEEGRGAPLVALTPFEVPRYYWTTGGLLDGSIRRGDRSEPIKVRLPKVDSSPLIKRLSREYKGGLQGMLQWHQRLLKEQQTQRLVFSLWGLLLIVIAVLILRRRKRGRGAPAVVEVDEPNWEERVGGRLLAISGPMKPNVFNIPRTGGEVGRHPSCACPLPPEGEQADLQISRRHFQIFRRDGQWFIRVLSKRGIFLNGRPLVSGEVSLLQGQDQIELGESILFFQVPGNAAQRS